MSDPVTQWRLCAGAACLLGACAIAAAAWWASAPLRSVGSAPATSAASGISANPDSVPIHAPVDLAAFDVALQPSPAVPPSASPEPSAPALERPPVVPDLELVAIFHEGGRPALAAVFDPRANALRLLRVGEDITSQAQLVGMTADAIEIALGEDSATISLDEQERSR